MTYRRTLLRDVTCTGIGLHSGKPVRLALRPAPPDHGIRFFRTDAGVEIPATLGNVGRQDYATTLSVKGVSVDTVEHLLAALSALGVDDAQVELDGPEVPVLDGSAAPWVMLLHEAGLRPQPVRRLFLRVLSPVEIIHGAKVARLLPSDHFEIAYTISFDHPLLRHQSACFSVTQATFEEELASARTFGFLRDVEAMRKAGLALGGSLENAIVIGETGVLNNRLRFEDEFVRHKILDAIGDLALLGHPLLARLEAHRAGHAIHTALARKLLDTPDAFDLVPAGSTRPEKHPERQADAVPARA